MNAVAENICKLRQEKRLTQNGLAEKLNVTRQTVSNWETGKNEPDIDTLLKIAGIFGTDINSLASSITIENYPRYQRKYIIVSSACAFVLIVCIVLTMTLIPYFEFIRSTTYILWPYVILSLLIYGILWVALGVLLPSIMSLFYDIRPRKKIRRIMLAAGILAVVPFALSLLYFSFPFRIFSSVLYFWFSHSTIMYSLLTISGICIFLYFNKY